MNKNSFFFFYKFKEKTKKINFYNNSSQYALYLQLKKINNKYCTCTLRKKCMCQYADTSPINFGY